MDKGIALEAISKAVAFILYRCVLFGILESFVVVLFATFRILEVLKWIRVAPNRSVFDFFWSAKGSKPIFFSLRLHFFSGFGGQRWE